MRFFNVAKIKITTAASDKEEVVDLTGIIFAELENIEIKWKKISKQTVIRSSKILWFILLLILIPGFFYVGWKALILLPAFPLVYYINHQLYLNGGYMLHESYLLWKWGWINRETLYLPIKNIQSVSLKQNPFDKRRNLTTLSIDTAGQSNTGGGPKIHDLPYEDAVILQKFLVRHVSESDFTW